MRSSRGTSRCAERWPARATFPPSNWQKKWASRRWSTSRGASGLLRSLPPYLPLALGAADMKLSEHVSAFTVFPNDGIRIDPHMIRRVTSYDGALLEEAHPEVHDVISPEVARTMTAMLEEVIQFGTGIQAKALGRPAAGKTGTTQDYTDAWFIGFTPQLTAGSGWVSTTSKFRSAKRKQAPAPRCRSGWNLCKAR